MFSLCLIQDMQKKPLSVMSSKVNKRHDRPWKWVQNTGDDREYFIAVPGEINNKTPFKVSTTLLRSSTLIDAQSVEK